MKEFSFIVNRKMFLEALTRAFKWGGGLIVHAHNEYNGIFFEVGSSSLIIWRANGTGILRQVIDLEHVKGQNRFHFCFVELHELMEAIKAGKTEYISITGNEDGSMFMGEGHRSCFGEPWVSTIGHEVLGAKKVLEIADEIWGENAYKGLTEGRRNAAFPQCHIDPEIMMAALRMFPKKRKTDMYIFPSDSENDRNAKALYFTTADGKLPSIDVVILVK